jgi:hypothetical protein
LVSDKLTTFYKIKERNWIPIKEILLLNLE